VYKVRHRTQGYCAALKAIDRASCSSDKLLKSLSAEIEIHSSLTHEFVVKLFSFFDDKSYFYILMEFCDKGELYNALQKEKK
jgi:aurora kinase, other